MSWKLICFNKKERHLGLQWKLLQYVKRSCTEHLIDLKQPWNSCSWTNSFQNAYYCKCTERKGEQHFINMSSSWEQMQYNVSIEKVLSILIVDSTVSIVVSHHIFECYRIFFSCPHPEFIQIIIPCICRFRSNMRQYVGVAVVSVISWAGCWPNERAFQCDKKSSRQRAFRFLPTKENAYGGLNRLIVPCS